MKDGDSVISRLEDSGLHVPRIRLPGNEARPDAEVTTPFAAAGHHVVDGEIGRGGVGKVLRCRDVDLGREVAMKVVLEQHLGNPEVVRRFVEEARIGGQLQHPGLVPVYELGLQDDRRPFFTMKLVKGDTLATVLEHRSALTDDRRRILSIFARACRTVAYAHSRGVVHRDLKPSNVMAGAYGEVQVLDWGLAKVLRRTEEKESPSSPAPAPGESRVGEVMGTIAYMSPEQANGRVSELDERTDVFALGAILLEILTGSPPYHGETSELFRQAREADLSGALRRLEGSEAEENLADLCRACLSPDPSDRPANACLIADTVEAHLTAVAERVHRYEVEAVERRAEAERNHVRAEQARATANEWRRRRRWAWMMGSAAVLALIAAIAGWQWVQRGRAERVLRADRGVERLLLEVGALQGKGDLSGAAVTALRAVELAGDASESIRNRAERRVEELTAEETRVRRKRELRTALANAALGHGPPLAEVLSAHAIDLERLTPEQTSDDLVVALDLAGDLRAIRLDSDAVRSRIRRAGVDELREIAGTVMAEETPTRTMHLLGRRLDLLGARNAAITILHQALRRYPGDFWVHIQLAECVPKHAIRHLNSATALRPRCAGAAHLLADAHRAAGNERSAAEALERADFILRRD